MTTHATFADGPLKGPEHDRSFNSRPPTTLWFAPQPNGEQPQIRDGWMLVGLVREPEIPYPGQIRYDLDEDAVGVGGAVVYRHAGECYRWTIHEHPDDFPQGYVARAWAMNGLDGTWRPLGFLNSPSVELARMHLPPGAWWNVGSVAESDRSIAEVWI